MSDKLILEFYREDDAVPLSAVLAVYGGDNPASAALTVTAFYETIKSNASSRLDAGELAARFILWQAELSGYSAASCRIDTLIIPPEAEYGYQLIRLRTKVGVLHVEVVSDQYSTNAELDEAIAILSLAQIPFEVRPLPTMIKA